MIRRTTDLSAAARDRFGAIIDVRSPAEFAHDHLPGARNLPVLDDDQRAAIGAEYVQGSKFEARRRGAALVARNIADHLEGPLEEFGGDFQPLVYCWRGGQRSGAMAAVMDQVGWSVAVLEGGYRTWRRGVADALYTTALSHRFIVLDGPTGAGKTALLSALAARGVQTIDLEALAGHRGSLFGASEAAQPSQKAFESALYDRLARLDLSRPVVIEAESSRVGERVLPPSLWAAMAAAPAVELVAPLAARVTRILSDYDGIASDLPTLDAALQRLPRHHSKAKVGRWREMAAQGETGPLVADLILSHYDPAYRRSASASSRPTMLRLELADLSPEALARAAAALAEKLDRMPDAA
jgi:tRNA 2-selenouridine synthase